MTRTPILDHGYIELIETWGSDERIVEAARMSTGKGFLGWGPLPCDAGCIDRDGIRMMPEESGPVKEHAGTVFSYHFKCRKCDGTGFMPGDEKLLRYLWTNKHTTPFEMAGMTVEVQAPIMVFREWMRHRTQSMNEMSARYIPLPDVNYVPSVERLMIGNDGKNKQAGTIKDAHVLTVENAESFRAGLRLMYHDQQILYQTALTNGVPKELARVHLPVGRYSRMRASANLLNWLRFLTLRMAPAAQWEIRSYANIVGDMVRSAFPRTWELFAKSRNGG
jgi:thymidylate synthase (FAD)